MTLGNLLKDAFSCTKAYIRGPWLGFCFYTLSAIRCAYIIFWKEVFLNRKFGEYMCKIQPKKRSKRRGSQEAERMSTRARSPEVDELSCVPET